jgi:hypothetical protein
MSAVEVNLLTRLKENGARWKYLIVSIRLLHIVKSTESLMSGSREFHHVQSI